MEEHIEGVFIGIDIGPKSTLLSYYHTNMKEPETISTVLGEENFQIPTFLAKKRGIGQWFFGNDAMRQVQLNLAVGIDNLFEKAMRREDIYIDTEEYPAEELLLIFLKRLLSLPPRSITALPLLKLVITVENLDVKSIELFTMLASRMGISAKTVLLLDHRESFYYFALSQEKQLYMHDVMLYDYTTSNIKHCLLKRNKAMRPQVINLAYGNHGSVIDDKDKFFDEIVKTTTLSENISAVYLIGDGFDGEWMKQSLQRLCKGRRVFIGKNLYSKGACYAGAVRSQAVPWEFVYIGNNELKLNLSLKVIDDNEMKFVTLISAGDSWYDAYGECEVILDGSPEIECWIQRPDSRKAIIETLKLTDMPQRENRTTRLRIMAKPVSDTEVTLKVQDLGFGEIVPATNRIWERQIAVTIV
ncbi:MAG: hypothetical protein IJT32_02805 [Lachnospiraceae bacterium]|nr:hypothetical protein [Lachnospiraceae bacterium]